MIELSQFHYDHWPRWLKIAYGCTFPVSEALATIVFGLVLMAVCVVLLPFEMSRSRAPKENADV